MYMCDITKKLSFLVKIFFFFVFLRIDNKTINCITLPLHKALGGGTVV